MATIVLNGITNDPDVDLVLTLFFDGLSNGQEVGKTKAALDSFLRDCVVKAYVDNRSVSEVESGEDDPEFECEQIYQDTLKWMSKNMHMECGDA